MNRYISICGLVAFFLLGSIGSSEEKPDSEYYHAKHGFNGGSSVLADLSTLDGFDKLMKLDDIARFARKVSGSVGFTAHPDFENGTRLASAVISYTSLSPRSESWPLYLYDKAEADKPPGSAPRPGAELAFQGRIEAAMGEARRLISVSGASGVQVSGHGSNEALACAVMRLGGNFVHIGKFGSGMCMGCRTVVKGGTPLNCALDVSKIEHWSCCGSTDRAGHCEYWKKWKIEEDRRIAERDKKVKQLP